MIEKNGGPMGASGVFKDINDYNIHAKNYSKLKVKAKGTLYLAFRDIPHLLEGILPNHKDWKDLNSLDYGCGAGRSTRFLKSLGAEHVDGVDINQEMLNNAKDFDHDGHYELIETGKIPSPNGVYDLVFCSFVFVEIGDKSVITQIYHEIDRILVPNGLFVIVTTTRELYDPYNKWLTYQILTDKHAIKSGEAVPLRMTDIKFDLFDYYWSDQDYLAWGKESGFSLVKEHHPLGHMQDGILWKSEATVSPYAVYIFQKHAH